MFKANIIRNKCHIFLQLQTRMPQIDQFQNATPFRQHIRTNIRNWSRNSSHSKTDQTIQCGKLVVQ